MELEKHERKLVLALTTQKDAIHHQRVSFQIWAFAILGVLGVGIEFAYNPSALDFYLDLLGTGGGILFLVAAASLWVDLRHRRLIQKLAKRLDEADPTWTIPSE